MSNFNYLINQVKTFDNKRYITSLFFNKEIQEKLFAIYSFNIELKNIKQAVSDHMLGLIRFSWWKESIEKLYSSNQKSDNPILDSLSVYLKNIKKDYLIKLIEGYEGDFTNEDEININSIILFINNTTHIMNLIISEILNIEQNEENLKFIHNISIAIGLIDYIMEKPVLVKEIIEKIEEHLKDINSFSLSRPVLPLSLQASTAKFWTKHIKKNNHIIYDDYERNKFIFMLNLFYKFLFKKL